MSSVLDLGYNSLTACDGEVNELSWEAVSGLFGPALPVYNTINRIWTYLGLEDAAQNACDQSSSS